MIKTRAPLKALAPMIKLAISPFLFKLFKVSSVFAAFQTLKKRYAPGIHYKLETIGVHPDHQGKGYSSDLIKPFIFEARKNNTAVYTETMTPSNVALYEHFGFKVMEKLSFTEKNLNLWSFLLK